MAQSRPNRRIRDQADLDWGLQQLLALDPRLEPIARACGPLPLRLQAPGFAGLSSIIVSQMVSRASADAIWGRIVIKLGAAPHPADWLALDPADIATFGLSRAKAAAIRAVAEAVTTRQVDLIALAETEADQAVSTLVALKGIGPWTAEVYLMFCGGHPDIFPAGDVALRAAVGHGLMCGKRPSIPVAAQEAQAWRPFRSIAARLFWSHYAIMRDRSGLPV